MKRFLRSKLVLTLAALIMIAAAVVIPLSGSIAHSHAQAIFPSITPNPTSGPAGTVVKVNGSGWTPGNVIDITLDSSTVVLVHITANAQGNFSTSITIPKKTELGVHDIIATGSTPQETAAAAFTVTCAPTFIPPQPVGAPTLQPLSCDPYKDNGAQHATEVEPDSLSAKTPNGTLIVSAFQVGRFKDGGAMNIGWATFTNGGPGIKAHGFLPGITKFAGGFFDRASDPSVAYDAKHNVWMIASLAITEHPIIGPVGSAVLVSRSKDGLHWDVPIVVKVAGATDFFDKEWIVCDNTSSSPFYGNCYIEWDNVGTLLDIHGGIILMSTSSNGGLTWGKPMKTADHAKGIGGQPLVQPNGTVIVPIDNITETAIEAFTSTNGGNSWNATVTISSINFHQPGGNLRAESLPSAEIDPFGKVYVVWSDCSLEPKCAANDLVMSSSTDGVHWNGVTVIPIDPFGSGVDHFIPGLAVSLTTISGAPGHLGLAYYYYPKAACDEKTCDLDVGFISSQDGGTTWGNKRQLAGPMKTTWLPDTSPMKTDAFMVGDYISTSFSSGDAFPVFAVATAPSGAAECDDPGAVCHEHMYTLLDGLR